jgi:hypothetical protein
MRPLKRGHLPIGRKPMTAGERHARRRKMLRVLAEHRRDRKDDACSAVKAYMEELRVSLDELTRYLSKR